MEKQKAAPLACCCTLALSALLAASAAFAAIPVRWSTDAYKVKPLVYECYHGETLDLAASMTAYGDPLDFGGKTARLYWQTNGMAAAWWSTNAEVRVESGATNVLAAVWSGAFDTGAASVTGFIGVEGENYRAAFELRFRASPGFVPNVLPIPPLTINWATVANENADAAPFALKGSAAGVTTNEVRDIVTGYGYTTTNAVRNIITNDVAPWAMAGKSEPQGMTTNAVRGIVEGYGYETATNAAATYQPKGNYLTAHQSLSPSTNYTDACCSTLATSATNYADAASSSAAASAVAAAKAYADGKFVRTNGENNVTADFTLGSFLYYNQGNTRWEFNGLAYYAGTALDAGYAEYLNKGSASLGFADGKWSMVVDGIKKDIASTADIPAAQIQSDWTQTDTAALDYIKNKPTIPAAQVNADWNAASGVAQILNKPTLANVATSGSYNDLTNRPNIPSVDGLINSATATNITEYIISTNGFETTSHASLTYQVKGNYLTSESDPVWTSDKPNYLTTNTASSTYYTKTQTDQKVSDAISTASGDATAKANAAQSSAISAAASDATSKANSARADSFAFTTAVSNKFENGKQNTIADLDTIRSGAALGATSVQSLAPATDYTTAVSNKLETGKQNTIADLTSIRAGASAGSTAVQPAAISDMATKTWVGGQGYLTSVAWNEVNNKPSWIGSSKPTYTAAEVGAEASGTASSAVSTHNSSANSHATLFASKQATISDLATIRSGAALGATALQSYTETDPTIKAWAKADTKPTYTAAEVGADASGAASSAVSGHNAAADAHATLFASKQATISDLATIRSGAAAGATAVQSLAPAIGYTTAVSNKLELANDTTRAIVQTWEGFLDGSNVVFSITNYISGSYSLDAAKFRILEMTNGVYREVYNSRDEIELHLAAFETNTVDAKISTVMGVVNGKADKAWGQYTSAGTPVQDIGYSNTVYLTAPETYFAGGLEFERVAVGEGMVSVLCTKGAPVYTQGEEGTFKFQSDGGTNYFGFARTDSYVLGADAESIRVANRIVTITYDVTSGVYPCLWYIQTLQNYSEENWEQLNTSDGQPIAGASHVVQWEQNPPEGKRICYVNCQEASGFFKATIEVPGSAKFITNMPADLGAGIICTNTATGVNGVIRPTFNGSTVTWQWSGL